MILMGFFSIFITVVSDVVTVATVKFSLSYCRDSNLEDSNTKSKHEPEVRKLWPINNKYCI